MALFQGEDLVDVTTPDGRTLTLPRSLVPASMIPQPQIGETPDLAPPQQELAPPLVPPPALEVPPQPNVVQSPLSTVEMGEPETRRVTQQQLAREQAAQKAAELKAAKAQAAYNATPEGQRAQAQTQQAEADKAAEKAVFSQADLQAATDDVFQRAVVQRNEKLDKLDADKAADMQQQFADEDKVRTRVNTLRDKIAGQKIDRELDHPILVTIGAALAGIGQAMQGKEITSDKLILDAIDRKVAAQEADLDRMGKIYGMTKDELDMLKERGRSKLEFHNTLFAAETQKAIRQIEEITARSASAQTKANAQVVVSKLQQEAAARSTEAMRWGLEYDQRDKHQKQQIQLGYANLAESKRATDLSAQLKREEMAFDFMQGLAAAKASGDAKREELLYKANEENEKRGLKGVDNDYLLTPEGRAKMDQAGKLEEQAKAIEAQTQGAATKEQAAQVDQMRQQAAVLRNDARLSNTVKARTDVQAGELSKKYAATQGMLDVIDEINAVYDDVGRQVIGRDAAQQRLQSLYKLLNVKGKDAWQLGAWDKGSANLSADIFGADPSKWSASTIAYVMSGGKMGDDPNGFKKRLEAVAADAMNTTALEVQKNSTWRGGAPELFTRKQPMQISDSAKKLSASPSGLEIEKDAAGAGVAARAGRRIYQAVVDVNAPSMQQDAEGAASSRRYPGLSIDQEAPFEERLQAYRKGDKRAGEELVRTVAEMAAKRPDFVIPLLHNLRDQAPQLYAAARSSVPKDSDVDKQMDYEEQLRIGTGLEPVDDLGVKVLNSIKNDGSVGDVAGYRELAARAGRGDPAARSAIASIVAASGTRKTTMQQDAEQIDLMRKMNKRKPGAR